MTIPLSGFQTPLSGPVTASVGIVAYEGDLGTTGDGRARPNGFQIVALPEPGGLSLLVLGGAGILARRRRS